MLAPRVFAIGDVCASRLQLPSDFCGFDAIAHGGIVANVLDEAGAWVIVTQLGKLGMMRNVGVHYHHPVPTRTPLVITAQVTSCDIPQVATRAEIRGQGKLLLAEAESHWILPPLGVLARVTRVIEGKLHEILECFFCPDSRVYATHLPIATFPLKGSHGIANFSVTWMIYCNFFRCFSSHCYFSPTSCSATLFCSAIFCSEAHLCISISINCYLPLVFI